MPGPWSVELEHRVGAPPETVFGYFTDPDKYRRWKGIEAELDPRPGGTYRVLMRPQVWVSGRYVAVDPPRRLVMTWGFESPLSLPDYAQVEPGSSTVEFTFVPDEDGTIIRVRHTDLPSEASVGFHTQGWNNYLGRLLVVLEGNDPGEDPLIALADEVLRGRAR
ncbi:MAG: SRPBCC domain-containing protein [Actinomycetota bacterium]|nr:SRPBCC domain-containing protein [Actinomycetota bacterium]